MMTYEEKFELIVKAIAGAKKYARKGYYPNLYYNEESGLKDVDLNQIQDILLQLQDDDKIITIKSVPTALKSAMEQATETLDGAKRYFTIDISDLFDSWYQKRLIKAKKRLQKETEYQDFTGKKPVVNLPKDTNTTVQTNDDVVYWITLTSTREILLNDVFLLAKPDFDSENEVVFDYLYKNPNKIITLNELNKEVKRKIGKSLHKIVENLGFKGDIKSLFFSVSKDAIRFRNRITKKEFEQLGIRRIKLILK